MTKGTSPVGPAGLSVLGVAAVAGIALGAHGWSARNTALAPGSVGSVRSSAVSPSPSTAAGGPSGAPAPSASGSAPSPTAGPGPLLSTQSYAQYAFQVWPGPVSSSAAAAETGLTITVRRQGSGISVVAGVAGQPPSSPQFYPGGTRVYVIEASMGDDSGNADYNLGDDGVVVTNAKGRIVQ